MLTENSAGRIWREAAGKSPDHVRRLPTGSCNYVFLVEAENGRSILRIAPKENAGILRGSLYWIGKLGALGLPIPQIIGADLGNDPPYLIMTCIEGRDLGSVYAELSEDEKRAIAREVTRAQSVLAGLPAAGGYGYLSSYEDTRKKETWSAVVADHLNRSGSRIRANGIFDASYVARVEDLMGGHEAYFSTIRPIPFFDDATTKNVLVHEGRFSGIVDLDWICFGDRLYTIALTKMALLSLGGALTYIDYLLEEENLSEARSRALDFYTLVFCVDFMSEVGMKFNKEAAPAVSPDAVAGLQARFEELYACCR